MTKRLINGESKILLAKIEERLDNHMNYIKEEFGDIKDKFKDGKKVHEKHSLKLGSHSKKIASLRTYAKVGAAIMFIIIGILSSHIMAGG